MSDDGLLSTAEVAELLGVHATTVLNISEDQLPYVFRTPGGRQRTGRRGYTPEAVQEYKLKQAGLAARVEQLEERLTAVEDELRRGRP